MVAISVHCSWNHEPAADTLAVVDALEGQNTTPIDTWNYLQVSLTAISH